MNCDIDRLIVDDKELTGHKDIADAMNSYFTSIASSLLANSNEIEFEFSLFQVRHRQIWNPSDLPYVT